MSILTLPPQISISGELKPSENFDYVGIASNIEEPFISGRMGLAYPKPRGGALRTYVALFDLVKNKADGQLVIFYNSLERPTVLAKEVIHFDADLMVSYFVPADWLLPFIVEGVGLDEDLCLAHESFFVRSLCHNNVEVNKETRGEEMKLQSATIETKGHIPLEAEPKTGERPTINCSVFAHGMDFSFDLYVEGPPEDSRLMGATGDLNIPTEVLDTDSSIENWGGENNWILFQPKHELL